MNSAVAPDTERDRIGDFGHAAIGVPNLVVGIPDLAERLTTFGATSPLHQIQMTLLPLAECPRHCSFFSAAHAARHTRCALPDTVGAVSPVGCASPARSNSGRRLRT